MCFDGDASSFPEYHGLRALSTVRGIEQGESPNTAFTEGPASDSKYLSRTVKVIEAKRNGNFLLSGSLWW